MIDIDDTTKKMYCLDINLKKIKALQQELTLEKNFLNAIFDVIPDLSCLKDINGVYLQCNTQIAATFHKATSTLNLYQKRV